MQRETTVKEGKFGVGDYEYVTERFGSTSKLKMQTYFIQRVSELVPNFSDDLDNELFDLYKQIPEFFYNASKKQNKKWFTEKCIRWYHTKRLNWKEVENMWNKKIPFENPLINTFVQKMFDWSIKYNLNVLWVREHAFETLDLWSHDQNLREKRYWQHFPFLAGFPYSETIPHPVYIPPKVCFEFRLGLLGKGFFGDIKSEINQNFVKELNKNIKDSEKEMIRRGMKKIKHKNDLDHFDWLIDNLVKRKSPKEITKKVNGYPEEKNENFEKDSAKGTSSDVDTRKVRQRISELAELLDLSSLREEDRQPGRRSKKLKNKI